MATGVSGMVADLLQANPALTPDQVKAILMKRASKSFPNNSSAYDPATGITEVSQYDGFTIGAGYVDLQSALALVNNASPAGSSMLSPTAVFDSNSSNAYFQSNSSILWGGTALWGTCGVGRFYGRAIEHLGQQCSLGQQRTVVTTTTSGCTHSGVAMPLRGTSSNDATEPLSVSGDGEN